MRSSLIAAIGMATWVVATPSVADTITAREIASGISENNTELQQEAWWEEHMARKRHEITGRIDDVSEGTFSGYWVDLKIGRDITVRCGMDDEHKSIVVPLRKGQQFTCKGVVSGTWTALFGVMFSMEMEAAAEAPKPPA